MLRLHFYNVTPPASFEVAGEGFRLNVDAISRDPSGEQVAKYAHGEWCVGERCFLRVECSGSVVCRFGSPEQSGGCHGPYPSIQLIDGLLVANGIPIAALHPGRGWVADPDVNLWVCVCLESKACD